MESDVVEMHDFTPLRLGHDGGRKSREKQEETEMGSKPSPMSNGFRQQRRMLPCIVYDPCSRQQN